MNLNLNLQLILSRSRNSLFNFRVIVCRIRPFPALVSKIKWFWSELPLTDRQRSIFELMDINLLDFISMKLFLVEQFQISLVYFSHNQVVWYNKIFYGSWSRVLNNGKLFSSKNTICVNFKEMYTFYISFDVSLYLVFISDFRVKQSSNMRWRNIYECPTSCY